MTSRMAVRCQTSATPLIAPTIAAQSTVAPMIASPPMLGVPVLDRWDCGPTSLTNCLNCFFSRYGSSSLVNTAPKSHAAASAMIGYRNISIFCISLLFSCYLRFPAARLTPCASARFPRVNAVIRERLHRPHHNAFGIPRVNAVRFAASHARACGLSSIMRAAISSSFMPRDALISTTSPSSSSFGSSGRKSSLFGKYCILAASR